MDCNITLPLEGCSHTTAYCKGHPSSSGLTRGLVQSAGELPIIEVHVIGELTEHDCRANEPMHGVGPGDHALIPGASKVGLFAELVSVVVSTVATCVQFGTVGGVVCEEVAAVTVHVLFAYATMSAVLAQCSSELSVSGSGCGRGPIARSHTSNDAGYTTGKRWG